MQRCQLFRLDQRELVDKVDKVLEARVQMGFSRQEHYVLEMRVVDVCVYSEQAFEDDFDDSFKVAREGNTQSAWEDLFVIQLVLNPGH